MAHKWTDLFPPFSICDVRVGKVNEGAFAAERLYKNKCSLWRHYLGTKEFRLMWSKTGLAQSLVMLRTIQSGSIVAGVGPSPAWSLGKWSCSVREHAELFAVIFLRSTDLEKKRHATSSSLLCNHLWNAKNFTLPWMTTTQSYCNIPWYTRLVLQAY